MRFDVYGRFVLDVTRRNGAFVVLQVGDDGKRRLREDIVLDPDLADAQVAHALDDLLHELAKPGARVVRIDREHEA